MFGKFCGDELKDCPVSCPATLGSHTPVTPYNLLFLPYPVLVHVSLYCFCLGCSSQCIVHLESRPCF